MALLCCAIRRTKMFTGGRLQCKCNLMLENNIETQVLLQLVGSWLHQAQHGCCTALAAELSDLRLLICTIQKPY